MNTYDLFTGAELEIAEKIQQRRYQLLIHSCIYYHLNTNIISDMQWDKWARELVQLQTDYSDIGEHVQLYDMFKDWDGSTGAFLPITLDWVVRKAQQLCSCGYKKRTENMRPKSIKRTKKRLF